MRCSVCRRSDRAVFARLLPRRAYLLLCGVCLDRLNAQFVATSLVHARHTKQSSGPNRSGHFWSRLAGVFVLPIRKLRASVDLNEGTMNRNQWNGGLKQLEGAFKNTGEMGREYPA